MKVRTGLAIILLAIFALTAPGLIGSSEGASSAGESTTWTIMAYMADDYAVTLNWQDDINEMEAAQQAPGTNIIALVDQYGSNNSMLLKVTHDPNFLNEAIVSTVIDDGGAVVSGGEVNMASSATLDSFVRFCASRYPADRLMLILWGHGASWRGLCPDGLDILTLPELGSGLSQAVASIGRPLDMVVVDSCAEASVEMIAQLQGYATILVSSEKDVPSQGLPYFLVLNDLASSPSQGPVRFGSRITDDYVTWSKTNSEYSVTMGVFNITKADMFLSDLNALSLVGTRYDDLFHESMRSALDSSEQYEEAFRVDFADLMLRQSSADLPIELKYAALRCILEADRVIEHFEKFSNQYATDGILVTNATGLTIYPPTSDPMDLAYGDLMIANSQWFHFGKLLRNDTVTLPSGPGPTVTVSSSLSHFETTDFPQTLVDTATLSWSGSSGPVQAVVYRHEKNGLVFVAEYESIGSIIEFRSPGVLTIAASAEANGKAVAYSTLNLTLNGSAVIRVNLLRDGMIVRDLAGHYTLGVVTEDGRTISGGFSNITGLGLDTYSCRVSIPQDAEIGDALTIEVRDASSGALVGSTIVSVPPIVTTVQVGIWTPTTRSENILVPVLFAMLPGLLILAFAVLMYRQERMKQDGRE